MTTQAVLLRVNCVVCSVNKSHGVVQYPVHTTVHGGPMKVWEKFTEIEINQDQVVKSDSDKSQLFPINSAYL